MTTKPRKDCTEDTMSRETHGRFRMLVSEDGTRCAANCPQMSGAQPLTCSHWWDPITGPCELDEPAEDGTAKRPPACLQASLDHHTLPYARNQPRGWPVSKAFVDEVVLGTLQLEQHRILNECAQIHADDEREAERKRRQPKR